MTRQQQKEKPMMAASRAIHYRKGTAEDMLEVQRVFLWALFDMLKKAGVLDYDYPSDEEIKEDWQARHIFYEYLTEHADQYWVAEQAGAIVGFSRSVRYQAYRELTELFIAPDVQSQGIGKELLAWAMPPDADTTDFLYATSDPRAQARYMKAGMMPRFIVYEVYGKPAPRLQSDRIIAHEIQATDEVLATLADMDRDMLGFTKTELHIRLLARRTGYFYYADDAIIGYGYVGPYGSGPFAAQSLHWFPDILAHAETRAAERGVESLRFNIPMGNHVALKYMLHFGYHFDSHHGFVMSNKPLGQLDSYLWPDPPLVV